MNHRISLTTLLRSLGMVFAVVLLGGTLVEALIHLRDLSQISHISGIWMTLAQALRTGVLYPPLEQDGYYAGTRYMPLYFLLIALLETLTGDYLLAAKLASLLAMLALLAVVFVAARRITGRTLDAFVLTSTILAFPEGRRALLSPHADALAVALAVAGLILIDCGLSGRRKGEGEKGRKGEREKGRKGEQRYSGLAPLLSFSPSPFLPFSLSPFLGVIAVLFALSVGAKLSSIAGCAAACLFLLRRERRAAAWLMGMTALLGSAGFVLLQGSSDGRFLENFRAVGSGGLTWHSLFDGPLRLQQALAYSAQLTFVAPLLLAPALFAVWHEVRTWRSSLWAWYFLCTLAATVLIFTSPGTDLNHLLELEVAAVLVVAGGLRRLSEEKPEKAAFMEQAALGLVAAALLIGLAHGVNVWRAGPPPDALAPHTLIEALPKDGQLLTEDATVAVLLGKRPVVMDAFAYRLLVERGLIDPQPLAERIRRQEFAVLVLIRRIEEPTETLSPQLHFGKQVTDAILESYRFERQLGAYYLYEPK
jgi:hypothetical protein